MWVALSTWCIQHGIRPNDLNANDLDCFLISRGGADAITERHAWRFLRLVDRILEACTSATHSNQAAAELLARRPDYRYANAADKDLLPDYLAPTEAARLVSYLSSNFLGQSTAPTTWKTLRDRASVALMLGSGITPGELRALSIGDAQISGGRNPNVPWKLRVHEQTRSHSRETPIAQWAGKLLASWLAARSEQGIPGPWMFPSTRRGTDWGKGSQYKATKEVLAAAGIEGVDGGSFRLRHTFALRQLRRGTSPEEVAKWLGVSDPDVMARYQRVLMDPVEVV